MSKNIVVFVLLLLLAAGNLFGQKKVDLDVIKSRYVYLLTSQRDSLDKANVSEEYFILERGKDKSQFMSLNSYKRDSIMMDMFNNPSSSLSKLDLSSIPKTNFTYRIIKDQAKNQVSFYDKIIRNDFVYEENPAFKWQITEEKKNIGNLKCQAARLSYGGRDYKAWFTNDIPVSDGPYKFYGLPGLIVEIEDSKKQYKFELLSYKNLGGDVPLWISEKRANGKKVSKVDFNNALKNTQENLVSEISKSGFTLDANAEARVKDNMKRKNNPIELQ
ncbi:GLPGLI family protein [Chryseobacterium sp.]|uniref:GLPGLI family protein n=1 Tax=Chryseobacterium sp. TaxID=1871047 RepID=UPI00289A03F8|nr:GLPGLI family protein [Chryseobacterium sp.]